jgi:hypothetical protein
LTDPESHGTLEGMLETLAVMLAPLAVFGLLALASLRWGRETRPGFDERLIVDDRPNWWPISHRPLPRSSPPVPPQRGTPEPAPEPVRESAPATPRPARPPRPATGLAWSVERPPAG